jgi:hypothetical protein
VIKEGTNISSVLNDIGAFIAILSCTERIGLAEIVAITSF